MHSAHRRVTATDVWNAHQDVLSIPERIANLLIALRHWRNTAIVASSLGTIPNYIRPDTYCDKMQVRKLFDRNPVFPVYCDKIAARQFMGNRYGDLEFAELLWSGEEPDLMPFDRLEPPYIVKPSNRSGARIIVAHGETPDRFSIVEQCRQWLDDTYGSDLGEWAYSRVSGEIMVERLLASGKGALHPDDYKLYVFDGKVQFIKHMHGRDDGRLMPTYLDRSWDVIPASFWVGWRRGELRVQNGFDVLPQPQNFDRMIEIAEDVGKDIDHVRVDFYSIDGTVYFGELTPYPESGLAYWFDRDSEFGDYPPRAMDERMGRHWQLPDMPLGRKLAMLLWNE